MSPEFSDTTDFFFFFLNKSVGYRIDFFFLSFRAIKIKNTNGKKKKKGFHQSDGLSCAPVVNDFDIRKKERKE